jgi:hypothetical protein
MFKTNFLKIISVLIATGLIFNVTESKAQAVTHPFLIVKESS